MKAHDGFEANFSGAPSSQLRRKVKNELSLLGVRSHHDSADCGGGARGGCPLSTGQR